MEIMKKKPFSFRFLQTEARSTKPDQVVQNMPELANLVYNMYMHMIQRTQQYRQVSALLSSFLFSNGVIYCALQSNQLSFFT